MSHPWFQRCDPFGKVACGVNKGKDYDPFIRFFKNNEMALRAGEQDTTCTGFSLQGHAVLTGCGSIGQTVTAFKDHLLILVCLSRAKVFDCPDNDVDQIGFCEGC